MPSITTTKAFLAAILFTTSLANPLPKPNGVSLIRRLATNYFDCDDAQETKLKTAFTDAATMANHAYEGANDNTIDSKVYVPPGSLEHLLRYIADNALGRWSHYFRTEGDGKAEDLEYAKGVFSAIASNNDPTNSRYIFSVRCVSDTHDDCKSKKRYVPPSPPP